jgi:hypothetical protein
MDSHFRCLPTWKGYSAVEGVRDSPLATLTKATSITLINPQSTSEKEHQEIYIMLFSHAQWESLQGGDFAVSAAAMRPGELGRSRKYVLAEPPRMIDADHLLG